MTKPTDFAYHLTNFLSRYLPGIKGYSTNTVSAYRDTFKLLLIFAAEKEGIKENKLNLSMLDRDLIVHFLLWIEDERGCSTITRNQRLAAVHSFCLYLQKEVPDLMYQFQEVLSIPFKKHPIKTLNFLSKDAVKAILSKPDIKTKNGRKHLCLLSLMYATGARVQEIANLRVSDITYSNSSLVMLTGKGAKSRFVPLEAPVIKLLSQYLEDFSLKSPSRGLELLFKNHSQKKLTRQGITYIFKKYADMVKERQPNLIPGKVSPHSFRQYGE
jgi:integrase/recombinase XerD